MPGHAPCAPAALPRGHAMPCCWLLAAGPQDTALFLGYVGLLAAAVALPVCCVLWALHARVIMQLTAPALGLALAEGARQLA